MYINNVVRRAFLAIKNIENKENVIKSSLNVIILGCYNAIVFFIKPIFNKNINFLELKRSISNVDNKINKNESNKIYLNNKEKNKIEIDKPIYNTFSHVMRKVRSDEIKASVINDIISCLEEIPTLEKEKIVEFKNELHFHSKWILFFGDEKSLTKIKNDFLETIVDSILNSDNKIKSNFGNIDNYKYFLRDSINNAIDDILYKN
ncbi:hypothetical protein I4902_06800 [Proteus alimentorum]|uniref:Uncharacterized protein n=1 Tax=Proteus alimentorum TaxID=1973495 RepID=A0ABS0ISJ0_9GAMM|nr:hypothetical protein [Proteus alimentorum]MBG2876265.1 hypothetical protein [Proteus alimentorum]MBG2878976.1 hypothetical protein [Proteus alimentorum]